jgi:hypothetical protein
MAQPAVKETIPHHNIEGTNRQRDLPDGYALVAAPRSSYTTHRYYWVTLFGNEILGPFANKRECLRAAIRHAYGGGGKPRRKKPAAAKTRTKNGYWGVEVALIDTLPCNEKHPLMHIGVVNTARAKFAFRLYVALDILRVYRMNKDGTETELAEHLCHDITHAVRKQFPYKKGVSSKN